MFIESGLCFFYQGFQKMPVFETTAIIFDGFFKIKKLF